MSCGNTFCYEWLRMIYGRNVFTDMHDVIRLNKGSKMAISDDVGSRFKGMSNRILKLNYMMEAKDTIDKMNKYWM